MIEEFLFLAVQITAIGTFILFTLLIFLPKLRSNSAKSYFFSNKETVIHFVVLSLFYVFLMSQLFVFNSSFNLLYFFLPGACLSIFGLLIAFIGRYQLRKLWNPITNAYNSRVLHTQGLFSLERHPIYLGRFLFFVGVQLMLNLPVLFLSPLYWEYLRQRRMSEERYLEKQNKEYLKYKKNVRTLI